MRKRIYEIIEIAAPGDMASLIYDKTMLVFIIASIIPLCFKRSTSLFVWIERITVAAFIVDYILRWITADFKYRKKTAFIKYPFTTYAMLDILSILPSVTTLSAGFKLFRLLRLNKTFKALRLLRYSKNVNIILNVVKKERQALTAVCILAGGYVFLSALVMFQVEPDAFDTFFDAVYWAMVTLTTVGYGDIYPTSEIGRLISMLSSFMGIAIVALPTGIITAGYMDELNNTKD